MKDYTGKITENKYIFITNGVLQVDYRTASSVVDLIDMLIKGGKKLNYYSCLLGMDLLPREVRDAPCRPERYFIFEVSGSYGEKVCRSIKEVSREELVELVEESRVRDELRERIEELEEKVEELENEVDYLDYVIEREIDFPKRKVESVIPKWLDNTNNPLQQKRYDLFVAKSKLGFYNVANKYVVGQPLTKQERIALLDSTPANEKDIRSLNSAKVELGRCYDEESKTIKGLSLTKDEYIALLNSTIEGL